MRDWLALLAGLVAIGFIVAAAFLLGAPAVHATERICGEASWYGYESGNRTASGERFDPLASTAAMPSRSHLGERWRVTYRGNSVVVRITDLGPAARLSRVIDLSRGAAERIGLLPAGVGRVCMERVP